MNNADIDNLTIPESIVKSKEIELEMYDLICDHDYISYKLVELWVNNCDLSKVNNVENVYYVGGTLCLDMGNKIVVMCNLNEIVTITYNGIERKRLLSINGVKSLFGLYVYNKGITKYFLDYYLNSWVKALIEKN